MAAPPAPAPPASPSAQQPLGRRLARLWTYFREYRLGWLIAALGTLVSALTEASVPALLKPLLDEGFTQGSLPIWVVPLAIVGLFALRGFAHFASQYALARIANDGMVKLRRQLFDRLLVAEAMIHQIDTLRFLVGALKLDSAHLGRTVPGLKGEDRCALMMSVPGGPPAVLFADFVAHGRPPLQTDHLELLGEEGAIRLSGNVLELFGKRPERVELDLEANYKASYRDTIAHFLDRLADQVHGAAPRRGARA
mgnify:CR=1 FL=1